jgi:beta-N-acetylhexosaminidase
MAAAYIRGYQDGGMLATAKHFPGRGDVDAIPGTKFFANNKPADQVEAEDFAAFKAAVDAGVTYVMTEHVAVPSVTDGSDLPASVSKPLVTGWLREKLGFKNIVTTDDMWYPQVVERFGPVKACVMAIQAGHDVVLKPADVAATIDGLAHAVEDGEISQEQIDRSVEKILYWKARLNLHRNRLVDLDKIADVVASPKHTEVLNTVADRSLTLLVNKGVLPLDLAKVKTIAHVTVQKNPKDPNVAVVAGKLEKALPGVKHFALGAKGADEKTRAAAVEAAKTADLVVVSLFCQRTPYADPAPLAEADAATLDEIFRAKPSATVVMSYGNPHFAERLKNVPAFLVGYGEAGWYGNQTIYADSFVRLLKGEITPTGKLPAKVSVAFPIGAGLTF